MAGFPVFPINFAFGSVGPINEQWYLNVLPIIRNVCCIRLKYARHNGFIGFANFSEFKRLAQLALHVRATSDHHQTRCGHVKAMNCECFGPLCLCSAYQAVLFVFTSTWHAQQT